MKIYSNGRAAHANASWWNSAAAVFARRMARVLSLALAVSVHCVQAEMSPGPGHVPFWLALSDSRQMDVQVTRLLAREAVAVTLRTPRKNANPGYQLPALIERLQRAAPTTPIMVYTWASRLQPDTNEKGLVSNPLAKGREVFVNSHSGKPLTSFGDVTNRNYRSDVAAAIAKTVADAGANGVTIDAAMRTPAAKPKPLARRCAKEPTFCDEYAQGMDALFSQVRAALGTKPMLYNGLWNFAPGTVADQAKLLQHADAAIVEYFGMVPNQKTHSFNEDILPYLDAMQALPKNRKLFVFGRGPWRYTDYHEDYGWQRYLYAAYLLAASERTYFKYHATFQVPTSAGRAGGLDIYADWTVPLGQPQQPYTVKNGVYSRAFANGAVYVVPDDGTPRTFRLPRTMYTPEGVKHTGNTTLQPGQGLLLLNNKLALPQRTSGALELQPLADWDAADWRKSEDGFDYLALTALRDARAVGEHDLLLDARRSMNPNPILALKIRSHGKDAQLLVVAEVDDPQRKVQEIVIALASTPCQQVSTPGEAIFFRTAKRKPERWPYVCVDGLQADRWSAMELDGNKVLSSTPYQFRQWRHLRAQGAMDIGSIRLSGGQR